VWNPLFTYLGLLSRPLGSCLSCFSQCLYYLGWLFQELFLYYQNPELFCTCTNYQILEMFLPQELISRHYCLQIISFLWYILIELWNSVTLPNLVLKSWYQAYFHNLFLCPHFELIHSLIHSFKNKYLLKACVMGMKYRMRQPLTVPYDTNISEYMCKEEKKWEQKSSKY
jgi:hypothetical protein